LVTLRKPTTPPRPTRWRGLLVNLGLLGATLAVCLVLVEAGLRLATGNENTTVLYEPDPARIARMRPDLDLVIPDPFTREDVRLRTDARGDRIPEDGPPPEPPGTRRVVVYGDSNIAALYTAYADTYPARLAARLGPGFAVRNAGLYGAGPDQSLIRMEDEWDRDRPDLAIFHLFLENDFGDLLRDRLVAVGPDGRLVRTGRAETDPAFGALHRLAASFLTARYLQQALGALRSGAGEELTADSTPLVLEEVAGTIPADRYIALHLERAEHEVDRYEHGPPVSWFHDHYEYDLALRPDGEGAGLKRELMRAVLAEARRFVAERGGRVLFLVEPAAQDMTRDLPIGPKELAAASPAYRPRASEEFVTGVLKDLGADAVSLWDPFERAGADGLFIVGDGHWNKAGMDLAARETDRHVRERWPELFGPSTAAR
jgi:SGNH hydrolase-like domain, acetyltransferase AlgX